MPHYTFKKEERLTAKKKFDALFKSNKSFTVFPIKLIWAEIEPTASYPVQLGISVPKRSFSKATDRNTIKRKIRESYRKNKHLLYEFLKTRYLSITLMVIYIAKEDLPIQEIERKMIISLQKMRGQIG